MAASRSGCGCDSVIRPSSRRIAPTVSVTIWATSASPSSRGSPSGSRGASPAPSHAGPVRPATRPAHAIRRVHPHVGRRLRAHVHAVLRASLGMGVGRHRRGDALVLGLLRVADLDVAPGVRIRRRHLDHGVHLHAAAATVRPGRAGHGDRDRHVPSIRFHGPVDDPGYDSCSPSSTSSRSACWAGWLPIGWSGSRDSCSSANVSSTRNARSDGLLLNMLPGGDRRAAQEPRPVDGSRRASIR